MNRPARPAALSVHQQHMRKPGAQRGANTDNPLFDLLQAVREAGSSQPRRGAGRVEAARRQRSPSAPRLAWGRQRRLFARAECRPLCRGQFPCARSARGEFFLRPGLKSHVRPDLHKVGFCRRQQGLMLRPEHARSVHTLADIAQQQLRFVPLASEDCFLACLEPSLVTPAVLRLCEVLGSKAWKQMMGALPGYALGPALGRVPRMTAALPWWRYRSSTMKMGTGRTTSIMSSGVGSEGLNVLRAADCGGRMGRMGRMGRRRRLAPGRQVPRYSGRSDAQTANVGFGPLQSFGEQT